MIPIIVLKKVLVLCTMFLLAILFLNGCAVKQEPIIKVKTVNRYIHPPNYLLKDDIELPKPIDKKTYIEALPMQREYYDTTLIIKLYKTIGKYKLKLKALRDFDKNLTK